MTRQDFTNNNDDDDDDKKQQQLSIPVITLQDVNGFRSAFEQFGFAVLQPIDPALATSATRLREAAYTFFRRSLEDKQMYSSGGTYGPPGWAAQGLESVQQSRNNDDDDDNKKNATAADDTTEFVADAVESFVYHGQNASNNESVVVVPDELCTPLEDYYQRVNTLLDQVMETCALSQGLDKDYFVPFYQQRSCAMRLAYYPAGTNSKYGAHTDYTGFTLLHTEKSGLQVQYQGGWIDVPCGDDDDDEGNNNNNSNNNDQMIINAGDLIPIWTNGRFTSAVHRVVATPQLATQDRLSIVFFTGPADNVVVAPIVQAGETPQYSPVVSGEHLRAKLASTNRR